MENRKLTKFEIWLNKHLSFGVKIVICVILLLLTIICCYIISNKALDRETEREDIAVAQFQKEAQ